MPRRAFLRTVARGPLFQTAVTWQNRAAMRNAVARIAAGTGAPGSTQRRREEVVASYWPRLRPASSGGWTQHLKLPRNPGRFRFTRLG